MKELFWRDIAVTFDGTFLEIKNSCYCRRFDLSAGTLRTVSLSSAAGRVLAVENVNCTDLECYGGYLAPDQLECRVRRVDFKAVEQPVRDGAHVLVEVEMFEPFSKTVLCRDFILYTGIAAYGVRNRVTAQVAPNCIALSRKRLSEEYAAYRRGHYSRVNEPLMDVFHPAEGFRVRRTVEFRGHTDIHENLVEEHLCRGDETAFCGNLLYCEDDTGAGIVMLQEAPPSTERREREEYDFRLAETGDIHSICWGILPEELMANCGKELVSYRNMVGIYLNETERERVLKDYLRCRFDNCMPQRKVVVNAWGCGNFGERLSPAFLEAEIRAAADCGGEVYQVDDQWQSGGSLGQFTLKNLYVPLSEFWQVNEEKVGQGGFDRLKRLADECGIGLALWLAPSTSIYYRDRREFSDLVLDFHRKYGFDLFKVDNAGFPTFEAEYNFEKMLADVRDESQGKVFFNLDITAGLRGGFFRLLEYGSLFVENRYAMHPWGVGYHPERTLRNIWRLARYVRLQNLQMEVASFLDAKPEAYGERKELFPCVYPWSYWAAVTLFTNPLLWFAPSSVPEEKRGEIRQVMELHKQYRDLIFSGEIFPLGEEPSGHALTGFVSRDEKGEALAVLLLREYEAADDTLALEGSFRCAGGEGHVDAQGLHVAEPGSFALFVRA